MSEERLQRKISELEAKIQKYEENGVAKLYYALNRKSWEMADLMNNINLRLVQAERYQSQIYFIY